MATRAPKRADAGKHIMRGLTVFAVMTTAFLLFQNAAKRTLVKQDALKAAAKYTNYAPALIRANELTLNIYSSAENQQKIAEGTLEYPEADATQVKTRAKQAFLKTPLNVKALTQIATADYLRTLTWSDRDLLALVKSRNARDRQTLMALSTLDVRAGEFETLLKSYDLRHRLNNLEELDLQILRGLSTLPDARNLIELELAKAPSWSEDYFRYVIPNWAETDLIDNRNSLFIFLDAQDDEVIRTRLLGFYFLQLKRLALYDTAFKDWSALDEVKAAGAKTSAVYNSDFRALSAPPPFNWRNYEPKFARAEIEAGTGLYASSSAPKRTLLTQQLISSPIGEPLKLVSNGQWQYREQQGYFFWRLSCMPARAPFYDINFGDASRASGRVELDIPPLPEGCEYQDLQLYAQPAGFNQRVSIRISDVDIIVDDRATEVSP